MIAISLYGKWHNFIVELIDDDLEVAMSMAEEMLPRIKKIDCLSLGIRLTIIKSGFVNEEWILPLTQGWSKGSSCGVENEWKRTRFKMEKKCQ